jgi:hypothetical protein
MAPRTTGPGDDRPAKGGGELTFRVVVAEDGPPLDIEGADALLVRLAVAAWRRASRRGQRIEHLPHSSKEGIGHDRRAAAAEGEKTA